jgi:hypothetical protein
MAINLKSEADKAGKHPSRRFGQRERKLLETVAAAVPFQVVKADKLDFVGGSTLSTITDSTIKSTDIVIVQVQSYTTAAYVLSVLPGNGSAAVTFNVAPGASTIQYIVVRALA